MKQLLPLFFALLLVACGAEPAPETLPENVEVTDSSVKVDINKYGERDVQIAEEDVIEVELNMDDEAIGDAQEAVVAAGEYCLPGETFTYVGEEGTVDSEVIGLTSYKGTEWCQAESVSTMDSPIGEIVTETIYYFDETFEEYWVVATVSGPMPAQTTEVHIIDGEVQ